jgi:hypothetical protein
MKIISGGQTGADQAGWRAAKATGLETGGWMPRGFKTEDGSHPEFAELYGAKEHESSEYIFRTEANVQDADVTLWFGNPNSQGGKVTYRCFRHLKETGPDPGIYDVRPGWMVILSLDEPWSLSVEVAGYLHGMLHGTVNIAGNRESKAPGIGAWVEKYLTDVFCIITSGETS